MKHAVVFALPGTSSKEADQTLARVDEQFVRRFAGIRRTWAYTSKGVRRKLERSKTPVASPADALKTLRNEGITHVAVKSLHLAAGMEYTELKDLVQDIRDKPGEFERIILSIPLLEAQADFERTVQCLLAALPAETGVDAALLLAAHGSRQPEAQAAYQAAAALCRRCERRVVLGTLMSHPGLDDVIRECKAAGVTKLTMMPLMIVPGFSARNELAGAGPTSWVSALEREGIRCTPLVRGLGDHDDIVRIWLDDAERMLTELSGSNVQKE